MGRRTEKSVLDDVFELLKLTPIWVGPVLAIVAFGVFRFIFPLFVPDKSGGVEVGALWRPLSAMIAWVAAGAVLAAWGMAELWKLTNRRLLDRQSGLGSIRDISWQEFELLVSEAYRRKGYLAEVIGTDCGDGGADIRLTGHGETVLVQCKHWRAYKVGVTIVRELLGVVVSERAGRGIIVTSGQFTAEARAFAQRNRRIELVDGPELAELVRGVQTGSNLSTAQVPAPGPAPSDPSCPLCGTTMVLRTARKGHNVGSQFWGCPRYPACRGTRQAESVRLAPRR